MEDVYLDKPLSMLIVIFPVTFLTCFINGSSSLLILQLTDLIIPFSILLQSALIFVILGEEKFLRVVSYSVVTVSTLFSIIGILEVFQIKIIDLPSIIPPGSTLGHRSFAAEYLLPSIPFLLIVKQYLPKEKSVLFFIISVINISFLLFTRNRSGLIILCVIVILYFIFIIIKKEKQNKIKKLVPVLAVLLLSFFISLIPVKGTERPDLKETANTLLDSEFKSNMLRLSFWDASIQMIKENPVTGVGLFEWSGNYPKYNGDYFTDENVTHIHSIHAHNDFLELFVESGIFSSVIFLLIYIFIGIIFLKRIKENEKYFYLLLTFLITAAYSLVAFPNHKFASFFLACVVSGIALVDSKKSSNYSFKFSSLKWLLLIVIIIGGITSYVRLKSELHYGEAIYLKQRAQYPMMHESLQKISEIFYPFDTSKQPVDYYRGIANSYMGRYHDALTNNLSGQELAPFNPILMRNIASSYLGLRNYNKAIEQLEKVKKYFPNYIAPQINLLQLYTETGQTEKAVVLQQELEEKSPDNPQLIEFKKN